MLLANQRQVAQSANQLVISIRSAELQYFSSFFSTFGVQSMVLTGVICGSISQTPAIAPPSNCGYFWQFFYFVTAAATVVTSCHVLLCSVFINVYGQGIALRGPIGSMVKAINGMIIEQKQTLTFFVWSIIFFTMQTCGMFFIVMETASAIACSLIILIGIGITYHYTLRIYNRFYWDANTEHWRNAERERLSEMDPGEQLQAAQQALQERKKEMSTKKGGNGGLFFGLYKPPEPTLPLPSQSMNPILTLQQQKTDAFETGSQRSDISNRQAPAPSVVAAAAVQTGYAAGAYLTLKVDDARNKWQRFYFHVDGSALLRYYKDKQAFQEEMPGQRSSVNMRPIKLSEFHFIGEVKEAPYLIILKPKEGAEADGRKPWTFRCDTRSEFDNWMEIFTTTYSLLEARQNDGSPSQGRMKSTELMMINSSNLKAIKEEEEESAYSGSS